MRIPALIRLAFILSAAALSTASFAASADDFKAAYAKAEAANREAAALKNQWTTTESEPQGRAGGGRRRQVRRGRCARRAGRGTGQCVDCASQRAGNGLEASRHPLICAGT